MLMIPVLVFLGDQVQGKYSLADSAGDRRNFETRGTHPQGI